MVGWKIMPTFASAKRERPLVRHRRKAFFEKIYIKQRSSSTRSEYVLYDIYLGNWTNRRSYFVCRIEFLLNYRMSVLGQRKHAVKIYKVSRNECRAKLAWAMPSDDESCINFLRSIKFIQWRVWSWLRMNASYRLNTCKSRGSEKKACFLCRRPAHGWVTRIQPSP